MSFSSVKGSDSEFLIFIFMAIQRLKLLTSLTVMKLLNVFDHCLAEIGLIQSLENEYKSQDKAAVHESSNQEE